MSAKGRRGSLSMWVVFACSNWGSRRLEGLWCFVLVVVGRMCMENVCCNSIEQHRLGILNISSALGVIFLTESVRGTIRVTSTTDGRTYVSSEQIYYAHVDTANSWIGKELEFVIIYWQ